MPAFEICVMAAKPLRRCWWRLVRHALGALDSHYPKTFLGTPNDAFTISWPRMILIPPIRATMPLFAD